MSLEIAEFKSFQLTIDDLLTLSIYSRYTEEVEFNLLE